MAAPKSHFENLQEELKTVPGHDVQERAQLERRIKAVENATVDGVQYKNKTDIYKDMEAEAKKIAAASGWEKRKEKTSEKFILLNDLALQYDPSGTKKNEFVSEFVAKGAPGGMVTRPPLMVAMQTELNIKHDAVKHERELKPDGKTRNRDDFSRAVQLEKADEIKSLGKRNAIDTRSSAIDPLSPEALRNAGLRSGEDALKGPTEIEMVRTQQVAKVDTGKSNALGA